jgi:succinate dehydrogenase/fumarate reductase flavoprotein subunit
MCKLGVDKDFGKGSDEYQKFIGDYSIRPNPTKGPVERALFYAIEVMPGDAGTKGGLLTDKYSRVLREDNTIIEGLYSAGNTSASVMGRGCLGAGVTIGPAMTFAYIAANHLASQKTK